VSNVTTLPGAKPPITGKPNEGLVSACKAMLAMAESGQLQSFIGAGFVVDGGRYSFMCDHHDNIYETLGSLVWLQSEYQARHPEGFK
jgi:hypothetical protein